MDSDDIEGRIFVGGLDNDVDEEILEKAFSMFGDITQILIMKDRETNHSRGFGFISFTSQEAADDAMQRMHGVEVMGRCVTVRKAEKQAHFSERGGFRGGRGGFRGGRGRGGDRFSGGGRYESRGRGSYSRGRPSDGYSGSYGDSRKGGFDSSRLGYRSSYDDSRSSGYGDSRRSSGYSDSHRSRGYGEVHSDEYMDTGRGGYPEDRYAGSRKSYADDRDDHARRYEGSMSSREAYYASSRREGHMRSRSKSPIMRYAYREESPVPVKMRRVGESYAREYSPVQVRRHAVREYSPEPTTARGRGYTMQDGRGYEDASYRGYSPPPTSRGKIREVSPDGYMSRGKLRASSPQLRERGAYASSRSGLPSSKGQYLTRKEYSSRPQEPASRSSRYMSDSSAKEYHSRAPGGRSTNGQERGPGSRSYAGHQDSSSRSSRYSSARHGGSPPPSVSSRSSRDAPPHAQKRASRRSVSPEPRARR